MKAQVQNGLRFQRIQDRHGWERQRNDLLSFKLTKAAFPGRLRICHNLSVAERVEKWRYRESLARFGMIDATVPRDRQTTVRHFHVSSAY